MVNSLNIVTRRRFVAGAMTTRRIAIVQGVALSTLPLEMLDICAAEPMVTRALKAGRPVLPEDLAFIRREPLRKQKQMIDPTGIETAAEAAVLAVAIEGVILFCISLPYGIPTGPEGRGWRHVTARGLALVELPPPLPYDPTQRHNPQRYSDWDIRNNHELAVTVDYGSMGVGGRMTRPAKKTWRMVFIDVEGVWKFDHYDK
jgi:hypothetical protein